MIPLKFRAQVAQQTHGRNKIVTVAAHPSYEVGQLSPVITGLYLVSGLDCVYFLIQLGMSSSQLTNSYFSEV